MTQSCPVGALTQALHSLARPVLTALGFVPAISVKKQMLAVGRIWQTHLETIVEGSRAAWGKLAHPRQALRCRAWGHARAKAGAVLIYNLGPR